MGAQDDRWDARALELFPKLEKNEYVIGSMDVWRDRALQLGREMADARAEEIAKRIDLVNVYSTVGRTTEELCAAIARGFISKPAEAAPEPGSIENPLPYGHAMSAGQHEKLPPTYDLPDGSRHFVPSSAVGDEARIRADEREKIVQRLDAYRRAAHEAKQSSLISGLTAARSVVTHADEPLPTRTREQVLEEALLKVPCTCAARNHNLPVWDAFHTPDCAYFIARRALEWKP